MAIFSNMVEKFIKVFIDNFLVFRESYNHCLLNLVKVLQCCVEINMTLNWEKCHFMVKEGIMLCHKVFVKALKLIKPKLK